MQGNPLAFGAARDHPDGPSMCRSRAPDQLFVSGRIPLMCRSTSLGTGIRGTSPSAALTVSQATEKGLRLHQVEAFFLSGSHRVRPRRPSPLALVQHIFMLSRLFAVG